MGVEVFPNMQLVGVLLVVGHKVNQVVVMRVTVMVVVNHSLQQAKSTSAFFCLVLLSPQILLQMVQNLLHCVSFGAFERPLVASKRVHLLQSNLISSSNVLSVDRVVHRGSVKGMIN